MSLSNLLDRLEAEAVAIAGSPVPPPGNRQGTGEPVTDQCGSPGSPGSLAKKDSPDSNAPGLSALLDRLEAEAEAVAIAGSPVPPPGNRQGTGEPVTDQCGSPGSPGSLAKKGSPDSNSQKTEEGNHKETAFRLWLIEHAEGDVRSHSFTPPVTEREIRQQYPEAASIEIETSANDEGRWRLEP